MHGFLANYRVMLVKPLLEEGLDTAEEILNSGLIPIVEAGTTYLEESPNPILQELAKKQIVAKDLEEFIHLIAEKVMWEGTHLYVSTFKTYAGMPDGEFYESKETVPGSMTTFSFLMNKKWPHKKIFNQFLMRYTEVSLTRMHQN